MPAGNVRVSRFSVLQRKGPEVHLGVLGRVNTIRDGNDSPLARREGCGGSEDDQGGCTE